MSVWLILLLDDPNAPHPTHDGLWIFAGEFEFGRENQGLVEVGVSIGEAEVVSLAHLDSISRVDDGRTADELTDRPLAAPALHRSAPPTVPGIPVSTSRPASPARAECEIKAVSGTAAPASHHIVPHCHVGEEGTFKVDHKGVDPFVADQDVGASTENLERDPFLPASLQECDQLVELPGTGEVRSRPSQTEPN